MFASTMVYKIAFGTILLFVIVFFGVKFILNKSKTSKTNQKPIITLNENNIVSQQEIKNNPIHPPEPVRKPTWVQHPGNQEPLPTLSLDARLIDKSEITGAKTIVIKNHKVIFGRQHNSDLPDTQSLVIHEVSVSRRHAILEFKNSAFFLSDFGSSNGVFLNRRRVMQEVMVKHGDIIRCDRFEFQLDAPSLAEPEEQTLLLSAKHASSQDEEATLMLPTNKMIKPNLLK